MPHPVRPTTESDDSPHSLVDVQRQQQAIYSQTIDELDNKYKINIAINVVASYYYLMQIDVFRLLDCLSIINKIKTSFSFSRYLFCIFVNSSELNLLYILQLITEILIRFFNC